MARKNLRYAQALAGGPLTPYVRGALEAVVCGAMPTGGRLFRAGMVETPGCACGAPLESQRHVALECPLVSLVVASLEVETSLAARWS